MLRLCVWASLALCAGASVTQAATNDEFFRSLAQGEAVDTLADAGSGGLAPEITGSLPKPTAGGVLRATPLADPVITPSAIPSKTPNAPLRATATPPAQPPTRPDETWDALVGETNAARRLDPEDWAPGQAVARARPGSDAKAGGMGGADPEPDQPVRPILPPGGQPIDPLDRMPAAATSPVPIEALPALSAALKRALDARDVADGRGERHRQHAALAFSYAARGFTPLWSHDGRPVEAVDSLLATLARAGDDALTIAAPPARLQAAGSADEIAASDIALSEAVVAYARQATGARVNPRDISPLIGQLPKLADAAEVLDTLAAAGQDAGTKLRELNPIEPRYVALRTKLVEMRQARSATSAVAIPAGPTLRVGMRDPRIPLLRARLHLDIGPLLPADAIRYDAELAASVADFQRANQLPPTGTLTSATAVALSGGATPRLEGALVTNMELWRWMPRDLGTDHIEVNVPDYLVTVFHDRQPIDRHRVVVGKTDTPTPLFSNTMKYLIVNPYWNVPQSIIKKEMLPKYGDLSVLDGRGYEVSTHGGAATVRQLPGPKNALGRIKFLFPNDYAVYLHDTPSKALFSSGRRAFSHGCVRVDQPFAFAETVLNATLPVGARKVWSEERLTGLIGEKERYINLPTALPIHIVYLTASVEDGRVKLREDIYGYARAVAAALGQTSEPAPKPRVVAEHVRRRGFEAIEADPR